MQQATDQGVLSETSAESAGQEVKDHRNRPNSKAFLEFMKTGWGNSQELEVTASPEAPYAKKRRELLASDFPGKRLIIPAGPLKVRSNDTDYRFRPHSAFAHLTGLGTDEIPDAVLVLHPQREATHLAVLYVTPNPGRETKEFFQDSRYGEFWVGRRRTLFETAAFTGIETRDIANLRSELLDSLGELGPKVYGTDGETDLDILVVPKADQEIEQMVADLRRAAGLTSRAANEDLDRATSELRLIKDSREVELMREAVNKTIDGFAEVVRALPEAVAHEKGERLIETKFDAHARLNGNSVGYETISAAGPNATTLHWISSTGKMNEGELLLVDAGVEIDQLYTADITRTLPINGKFTETQRKVYGAVYDATQAAFLAAQPGAKYIDPHNAAMKVLAGRLEEWGLLPADVTAESTLKDDGGEYRRWMVHGTSHHLGLDVHDCASARDEFYKDGTLEPGMIFTIEPGLYFKPDDLTVPEEYRGIGVRIEDDILINADGPENLSAALPASPDAVEAWMAQLKLPTVE